MAYLLAVKTSSNIKIAERGKIDNLSTQIHDCSLGAGTSIKK
jgi:hypothetical protein